ncbi:MAG: inositol monophosphatase family protein [Candidatus Eisenbacteria bacterium]
MADVAGVAGGTAVAYFGHRLEVELKGDGSPVTRADREAEQVARDWIEARFPCDGIWGEEFGQTRPGAHRRWFLDPVDGTRSFVKGVPLWGTLIAVVEGDEVLAGAIAFPATGEVLAAARGEGAWRNGVRLRVSQVDALAQATLVSTDLAHRDAPDRGARWRALAEQATVMRTWGDCFGYRMVATGDAEAMTDMKLNPWDAAPVMVVVEEAGGVCFDWQGAHDWRGAHGLIACNAALAVSIRAALVPQGGRT